MAFEFGNAVISTNIPNSSVNIHTYYFILLGSQPPLECITSLWNVSVKNNSKILVKHLFICSFMTVVSCLWVAFRSEVCWVAVGGKVCAC